MAKIYTRIEYVWRDNKYVVEDSDSYDYDGELELCCWGSGGAQDKPTQTAASAAAEQAAATQAKNAATAQTNANNMSASLYGTYDPTTRTYSGGSVSEFLDPSKLNQKGLYGTYLQQYNSAADQVANNTRNAVGSTFRNMASRGMGATPTGFGADQQRQAFQTEAGQLSSLYGGAAGQQLSDATNNFWQANNMLNNSANVNQASATANNAGAAGTNASLYGTASTQTPNVWGNIMTAAAGNAGAGSKVCWIAEAIYGVDDIRTHFVRSWLWNTYRETPLGFAVVEFYRIFGKSIAWFVRRSSGLQAAFRPLFDGALNHALAESDRAFAWAVSELEVA